MAISATPSVWAAGAGLILDRFPVTLELALLSLLVAVVVGIPLGVISAVYRNTPADLFGRLFALIGLAAPNFLVATVLIYVLSVYFGYLPNAGNYAGRPSLPSRISEQMMLPALTLGLAFSASVMRTTRSAMLEVLSQDYVRPRGPRDCASRCVVRRHALRTPSFRW